MAVLMSAQNGPFDDQGRNRTDLALNPLPRGTPPGMNVDERWRTADWTNTRTAEQFNACDSSPSGCARARDSFVAHAIRSCLRFR